MSHPDNEEASSASSVTNFKRRVAALEDENRMLREGADKRRSTTDKYITLGRAIRRLVSLADRVEDLIAEADRRVCGDEHQQEPTDEENRLYHNYQELLRWIPSLRQYLSSEGDGNDLGDICKSLNKGADGARGDDASGLKAAVISWLTALYPTSEPMPSMREKSGRGFYHAATGRLLCPVDYDWDNDEHKFHIRNFHPDFLVTHHSWPRMVYENEQYDPKKPCKGLFKNALLLKAFKSIFTSPSSAESDRQTNDGGTIAQPSSEPARQRQRLSDERRTRSHVAALLGMKAITPRSIAYAAVQLRFALSSLGSWNIQDDHFNYEAFYYNIITYFEGAQNLGEKKEISDLLLWWNRGVFGRVGVSEYRPQAKEKLSVAATLRKRSEGNPNSS